MSRPCPHFEKGGIGRAAIRAQTGRGGPGGDDPHIGEIRLSSLSPSVEVVRRAMSRRRQRGQPVRTAGGEIPVLGVPAPPSVFLKSVPIHYRACVRERFLSFHSCCFRVTCRSNNMGIAQSKKMSLKYKERRMRIWLQQDLHTIKLFVE